MPDEGVEVPERAHGEKGSPRYAGDEKPREEVDWLTPLRGDRLGREASALPPESSRVNQQYREEYPQGLGEIFRRENDRGY